jgi:hypothetical protein
MGINVRLARVIIELQKHKITDYTFTAFGYTCFIKKNKSPMYIRNIWNNELQKKIGVEK